MDSRRVPTRCSLQGWKPAERLSERKCPQPDPSGSHPQRGLNSHGPSTTASGDDARQATHCHHGSLTGEDNPQGKATLQGQQPRGTTAPDDVSLAGGLGRRSHTWAWHTHRQEEKKMPKTLL